MATNYKQPGLRLELTVPVGGVTSGQAGLVEDLFVVWLETGAEGDTVAAALTGVFELPLKDGDTPGEGARLYWDDAEGELTETDAEGTYPVGAAARAVTAGVLVDCRLDGKSVTMIPVVPPPPPPP